VGSLDENIVRKALRYQAVLTLLLAAGLTVLGVEHGYSALIGGGAATIANGLFAYWAFKPYRAQQPGRVLARIYGAELLKIAFVTVIFVSAFRWLRPLSATALLGCFLIVHLVQSVVAVGAGPGTRRR
jgi:ATP synthase protein I